MSAEPRDRFASLLLKAIDSLPEKDQKFVLERLLAFGMGGIDPTVAGSSFLPAVSAARKVRKEYLASVLRQSQNELRASGAASGGPSQMLPVRLSDQQYERLKRWCEQHGFSMAVVIRGLVEKFLEGQER